MPNPLRSIGALRQYDEEEQRRIDEEEIESFKNPWHVLKGAPKQPEPESSLNGDNFASLREIDEPEIPKPAYRKPGEFDTAESRRGRFGPLPSEDPGLLGRVGQAYDDKIRKQAADEVAAKDAEEEATYQYNMRIRDPSTSTGEAIAATANRTVGKAMEVVSIPFNTAIEAIDGISEDAGSVVEKLVNVPFEISDSAIEDLKARYPEKFDPNTTEGRRNIESAEVLKTIAGLGMTGAATRGAGVAAKAVVGAGKSLAGIGMPEVRPGLRVGPPDTAVALALPKPQTPKTVLEPPTPFPEAPGINREFPKVPEINREFPQAALPPEQAAPNANPLRSLQSRRAGEGGAAIDVIGEAVVAEAKQFADSFKTAPGLEKIEMPIDPRYPESRTRADRALSLVQAKMASAGDTWGERSRAIEKIIADANDPVMSRAIKEAIYYQDMAERGRVNVAKGEPVLLEEGMSIADALERVKEAQNRVLGLPPGHDPTNPRLPPGVNVGRVLKGIDLLDKVMPMVEEMQTDISDLAIKTKQIKPSQVRKNYLPHYLEDSFQKDYHQGVLEGGDAAAFAKRLIATGDTSFGKPTGGPGLGAPIKFMGEKAAFGSKKALIRTDGELDPFGALGVKGAAVARHGHMNEFVEKISEIPGVNHTADVQSGRIPFNPDTMAVYDVGGKGQIFSKDIAIALSKAMTFEKPTYLGAKWQEINNAMRKGVLKYSPGFQLRQIFDDIGAGVTNAPWGSKIDFLKGTFKHAKILYQEFKKINKGEFSPIIEKYRESGAMTEIYESLVLATGDGYKQISGKTKYVPAESWFGKASRFLDEVGQTRETSIKASHIDILKKQGASPDQAASVANYYTGDYITRSESGKIINLIAPMTKWYRTALHRLTVGAVMDPVSGKKWGGLRGVANSPWTTIIPALYLTMTWNSAVTGGKRWDFDGFIIPGSKWKMILSGYTKLITDLLGVDDTAKSAASKGAPPVQTGVEYLTGRKTSGSPVNPHRRPGAVPDEKEDELAWERGKWVGVALKNLGFGIPGTRDAFQNQENVNKFAAVNRLIEGLLNEEKNPGKLDKLAAFAKSISPIQLVDMELQDRMEEYPAKEKALSDFANSRGNPEKARAALNAWLKAGGSVGELRKAIEAGQAESNKLLNMSPELRRALAERNREK